VSGTQTNMQTSHGLWDDRRDLWCLPYLSFVSVLYLVRLLLIRLDITAFVVPYAYTPAVSSHYHPGDALKRAHRYEVNRQRGKKKQTLCLYNCVPAKSLSVCFAMNVIYEPPVECNTPGRADFFFLVSAGAVAFAISHDQ
jgi:hypothetical protein